MGSTPAPGRTHPEPPPTSTRQGYVRLGSPLWKLQLRRNSARTCRLFRPNPCKTRTPPLMGLPRARRVLHRTGAQPLPLLPCPLEGTDTFKAIHYNDIPLDRRNDVTYTRVVCEYRPQKADPNRTRITIGGNRICYPGDTGTRTGSLELVKLQINSTLSTPGARFACFDISNFYLGTPMDRPEYVRIKLTDIPTEFIDEYTLTEYAYNGWVYFKINKGVYSLKQAGKLANDLLTERLQLSGYYQCPLTPGLWRHQWRPISFVLIVDDFGIKYVGKRHADHLLHALHAHYTVTTDCQCPTTSPTYSSNSTMHHQRSHSMHRTRTAKLSTEPKNSFSWMQICHHSWMRPASSMSRQSWDRSCITRAQSTINS
ncbi:hypothetical protein ACHAXH_000120 [Discostella pseudostelligera]